MKMAGSIPAAVITAIDRLVLEWIKHKAAGNDRPCCLEFFFNAERNYPCLPQGYVSVGSLFLLVEESEKLVYRNIKIL